MKKPKQPPKKSMMEFMRNVLSVPKSAYRLNTDSRRKHLWEDRRELALLLATYGSTDGTSIRPAIEPTLTNALGWSKRTIYRRLEDLQNLGFLTDKGIHEDSKVREWTLNIAKMQGITLTQSGQADTRAGSDFATDSTIPLTDSTASLPDSTTGVTASRESATQSLDGPKNKPTNGGPGPASENLAKDCEQGNFFMGHSLGGQPPARVASPTANSCTSKENLNDAELTPHQVMERFQENLRKLLDQRKHCVTEECREELDAQILAARWAVQEQQRRLKKEGS
jgi:hypothetical protein